MTQVIVSLSTIPPRFPFIGQTLRSLLNQSVRPDRIEVWIPRSYRRFPEHSFRLPDVPDGVTIEVTDEDLGPATKILPCVRKYRGTDTRIVYVDDDRRYWNRFLETRLQAAAKRPDMCIAAIGSDVGFFLRGGGGVDKIKVTGWGGGGVKGNYTRLPRIKPRRGGLKNLPSNIPYWIRREIAFARDKGSRFMLWPSDCGYADIAEGFSGVLVKPDMFNDEAFDIPPILWAVDDIWLSGCLARKDIPVWVEKIVVKGGSENNQSDNGSISTLAKAVIDGHDRRQANRAAIRYFQDNHRIWLTDGS